MEEWPQELLFHSFIYLFRLYWVFTAVHRLSLVVVCGLLTVTSPVAERGF